MKTAEVAIEHVLTGLLALCAFLLPLLSGLQVNEKLIQSEALIGVLGLAYLFGVVFDRLADTLLSPIEQRLRLRLASESLKRNKAYRGDPFPQDFLEFSLRGEQNGRVDWMDSLRSRIRTSRGLAVFGFPAAMGIAIFFSAEPVSQVRWYWWPHLAVAINLVLLSTATAVSSIRHLRARLRARRLKALKTLKGSKSLPNPFRKSLNTKADELLKILKPVRTNELRDNTKRTALMNRSTKRMLICSFFFLLMQINSAVTVATLVTWPKQRLVIWLSIVLATALPLVVWYRITETHMNFIHRKLSELLDQEKRLKVASERKHRWIDGGKYGF